MNVIQPGVDDFLELRQHFCFSGVAAPAATYTILTYRVPICDAQLKRGLHSDVVVQEVIVAKLIENSVSLTNVSNHDPASWD